MYKTIGSNACAVHRTPTSRRQLYGAPYVMEPGLKTEAGARKSRGLCQRGTACKEASTTRRKDPTAAPRLQVRQRASSTSVTPITTTAPTIQ